MTPTPELYVAHPVLGGAVVTDTTVYVARCPHEGCHHAPDHGDPQVALDAVMGHWHREHASKVAALVTDRCCDYNAIHGEGWHDPRCKTLRAVQ